MPRSLHLANRVLRALLTFAALGLVGYLYLGEAPDWAPFAAVVTAITAIGLSPALWPALPAPTEKPAPPAAPPQQQYQPPQQQQQYQPQQQSHQPHQGTTYGGQAQVPQQQQWPGRHQQ